MKNLYFKSLVYSSLLILLLSTGVITGCLNQVTKNAEDPALVDDGYVPDSPKWNANSPIELQKVNDKNYQVILDWEPVTTNSKDATKRNIIGYNVYRRRATEVEKKIVTLDAATHYYADKSLEVIENEKYTYTVAAFDNYLRESNHNDPQTVQIQPEKKTVPKPPTGIFFAPGSPIAFGRDRGEVIISWSPPTENVDGTAADDIAEYEIESHSQDQTWMPLAKVPASKNIFIDSNLVQGTYFYRVRAKNSWGNYSQYVDGNFSIFGKLDDVPPGQITNLECWYQQGKNHITWANPRLDADGKTLDMIGVKIYRKPKGSNEPFGIIRIIPPDTSFTDYNFDVDKYYIYALTAFDQSGNESIMSKPVSTEPKVQYLETPTGLYARLGSDATLTLNWTAVMSAVSYNVYRSELENGIYVKAGDTAVNSYFMNVPYGKSYYFRVSAVDKDGLESSQSACLNVVGNMLYKVIEAETFLGDIANGKNAVSRDFDLDVNVIDFTDADQKAAYLRFSPISYSTGQQLTEKPLPCKDENAVDKYFEIPQFLASGAAKCDIWIKKGPDCGTYKIEAEGTSWGPLDCYSKNDREVMKIPVNFTVPDDATNHGKIEKFRFTCVTKNGDSSDYKFNIDKIVVYR